MSIPASPAKDPKHQRARAESLREITDADMVRGGIIDLVAYLQDFWKKRHPGRLRSSVSGPLRGAGRHCRRALSFVTAYIRSTSA